MDCPSCRTKLADDARFCAGCGAALASLGTTDPLRAAVESALGSSYRVLRLLGRGGMGTVYLARELALDRLVAVKVLAPDRAATAEAHERFRREARTAARLTHPNIVPLHSFGESGTVAYFVMGYVNGESLATRLRRERTLGPAEASRILADVASALDYAHGLGVVHRDVKPENVLIDDASGRALLADFGVARQTSAATLTETGAVVGTPEYMSPEQASGKEVDGRSDLYALGVIGYAMLSGRRPFEGNDARSVLLKHMTEDPPPLEALLPSLPGPLAAALMRCLAKDPAKRWPDGKRLAHALAAPDEGELPEPLEYLSSLGAYVLHILWVAGSIAACFIFAGLLAEDWRDARSAIAGIGTLAGASIATLGAVLVQRATWARRKGFPWRQILWAAFLQPRWHKGPWPARLKRPDAVDVSNRMPSQLRQFSSWWFAAALAWVGVSTFPLHHGAFLIPHLLGASPLVNTLADPLGVLFVYAPMLLLSLRFYRRYRAALRWLRDQGVDEFDIERALFDPASPVWRKPHMARLLLPGSGTDGAVTQPQSPLEYLQAIIQAAGALSPPIRPVGDEAVAAARQILSALDALERELPQLVRDADPAEARRLEERLATLSPDGGPEEREMRALMDRQLDLLRKLTSRREALAARRDRLRDLLRTLWLELANLRAQTAGVDSGISGHVRALCTEIDELARALTQALPEGTTLTR